MGNACGSNGRWNVSLLLGMKLGYAFQFVRFFLFYFYFLYSSNIYKVNRTTQKRPML